MEEHGVFKKGAVVRHKGKDLSGVVMEWGMYNKGYQRFSPSHREVADSLMVSTTGRVEIWPLGEVELK